MQRLIKFPIKGTYYYSAADALKLDCLNLNSQLSLIAEPDNYYDKFAIQIWLKIPQNQSNGYLLGYIPKVMSKRLSLYLKHAPAELQITHLAQRGKHIEIDCYLTIEEKLMPYLTLRFLGIWSLTLAKGKRIRRRLFS